MSVKIRRNFVQAQRMPDSMRHSLLSLRVCQISDNAEVSYISDRVLPLQAYVSTNVVNSSNAEDGNDMFASVSREGNPAVEGI